MHNNFKIVLYTPEIPGNTGSIGRTCVALGCELILIKPYGFDLTDKAVRRAGLDYWKHVKITEYENWQEFIDQQQPEEKNLLLFSRFATKNVFNASINKNSYLIFGAETKGLPQEITSKFKENLYKFPMYSEHIRSINLSNIATAAAYEAVRQINFS